MPALTHAVFEFRYRDAGDSNVTDRMREEPFEYGGGMLLNEVDADIGIQHQLHAKGRFRFWMAGCRRPCSMKSAVNFVRLSMSGAHESFLGRMTRVLPRC